MTRTLDRTMSTLHEQMIEALPGALFVARGYTAGSEILWANSRTPSATLGATSAGQVIPKDWFGIDPAHRQVLLTRLQSGTPVTDCVTAFQAPGEGQRWGRISVTPLARAEDASPGTYLIQIVDLQAAAEMAERSGDEAHLIGDLDALQEQKNRLISVFSHDLRNPLTVILGNAQLIEADECSDDIRESANDILSSAQQMREMIDTLVLTRRLEDPRLLVEGKPCNVAEIARRRVELLAPTAEKKKIDLVPPDRSEFQAVADDQMLSIVLDAYLTNGIKFSSSGDRIVVRVEEAGNGTRLVVTDTGPGFSEEDRQRLFDKFSKLSALPTGDESCLGLGLYLAARAARAMRAQVSASSPGVGQGSEFVVLLADPPVRSS